MSSNRRSNNSFKKRKFIGNIKKVGEAVFEFYTENYKTKFNLLFSFLLFHQNRYGKVLI